MKTKKYRTGNKVILCSGCVASWSLYNLKLAQASTHLVLSLRYKIKVNQPLLHCGKLRLPLSVNKIRKWKRNSTKVGQTCMLLQLWVLIRSTYWNDDDNFAHLSSVESGFNVAQPSRDLMTEFQSALAVRVFIVCSSVCRSYAVSCRIQIFFFFSFFFSSSPASPLSALSQYFLPRGEYFLSKNELRISFQYHFSTQCHPVRSVVVARFFLVSSLSAKKKKEKKTQSISFPSSQKTGSLFFKLISSMSRLLFFPLFFASEEKKIRLPICYSCRHVCYLCGFFMWGNQLLIFGEARGNGFRETVFLKARC